MKLISIKHLQGAAQYSIEGLLHAWQKEAAFRHACLVEGALLVLFVASIFATKSSGLFLLVALSWLVVIMMELLNGGLERVCDLVTKEWNPYIKQAKDLASAAVFIAVLANIGLWIYLISRWIFSNMK